MIITAFFTDSGTPAIGLSPTIRIRDLLDNSLVVTDAAMPSAGDGNYKYDYVSYDVTKEYSIRCDGGATLTGAERYTYGGNENYYDDVTAAVWEEELADHTIPGTYGAEVATKADLAASTSTTFTTAITGGTSEIETGTFVNTYVRDGIYWQITESAVNGLTVEFIFNIPDDDRAGVFNTFGRYEGFPAGTHYLELWAYNYAAAAWEQLVEVFMPGGNISDAQYQHEYYERHIDRSNNEVRIRIVHNITSYSANHNLYLDYVAVTSIDVVTAEEIAQAVWTEPVSGYNNADAFGGLIKEINSNTVSISASLINISNDLKRALGLMHENIFIDDPVYDSNCNLNTARVRIYSDSISVGTSASVIGEYEITAPATEPGKFTTWKQVRV